MAPDDGSNDLANLREQVKTVKHLLSRTRAQQVQAVSVKSATKKLVAEYFNNVRPQFQQRGLDDDSLAGLDHWMQQLLTLTQKAALKSIYNRTIKSVDQELNGVEVALVTVSTSPGDSTATELDGKELGITRTLTNLVPSAGASYEQACSDLRDGNRRSYRGAAAELREALREVLDHLAPDKDVTGQPNFKLEKDTKGPTMQQKVRFILKSRGKNKTQTKVPENVVSLIEDRVGALARSVYNRSSLSTHVATSKQEVQQIKGYVDVVLGEVLEIA